MLAQRRTRKTDIEPTSEKKAGQHILPGWRTVRVGNYVGTTEKSERLGI